jgi:plasmid maintenance system antidote protein VapI
MTYPDFTNPTWLDDAMKARDVQIYQLAAASGINRDTIRALRADGRKTTIKTAIKLATALEQMQ